MTELTGQVGQAPMNSAVRGRRISPSRSAERVGQNRGFRLHDKVMQICTNYDKNVFREGSRPHFTAL